MYAASAEDLSQSSSKNARAQVLRDFVSKLRERVPTYDEFEADLKELNFLAEKTRDKPLVQYLLRKLDAHFRTNVVPDYSAMTIEHIAPENPPDGKTISAELAPIIHGVA